MIRAAPVLPAAQSLAAMALAAMALAAMALGGCAPTFTVDVFNDTDREIDASLTQAVFLGENSRLASGHVRPGQTVTLGPVDALPLDPVSLIVRPRNDEFSYEDSVRVLPGYTFAFVGDGYSSDVVVRTERRRPQDGVPPGSTTGSTTGRR